MNQKRSLEEDLLPENGKMDYGGFELDNYSTTEPVYF